MSTSCEKKGRVPPPWLTQWIEPPQNKIRIFFLGFMHGTSIGGSYFWGSCFWIFPWPTDPKKISFFRFSNTLNLFFGTSLRVQMYAIWYLPYFLNTNSEIYHFSVWNWKEVVFQGSFSLSVTLFAFKGALFSVDCMVGTPPLTGLQLNPCGLAGSPRSPCARRDEGLAGFWKGTGASHPTAGFMEASGNVQATVQERPGKRNFFAYTVCFTCGWPRHPRLSTQLWCLRGFWVCCSCLHMCVPMHV